MTTTEEEKRETQPCRLELTRNGMGSKIIVNGQEINHVRSLVVATEVNSLTVITLEIVPQSDEIVIDAEAAIVDREYDIEGFHEVTHLGEEGLVRRFIRVAAGQPVLEVEGEPEETP